MTTAIIILASYLAIGAAAVWQWPNDDALSLPTDADGFWP